VTSSLFASPLPTPAPPKPRIHVPCKAQLRPEIHRHCGRILLLCATSFAARDSSLERGRCRTRSRQLGIPKTIRHSTFREHQSLDEVSSNPAERNSHRSEGRTEGKKRTSVVIIASRCRSERKNSDDKKNGRTREAVTCLPSLSALGERQRGLPPTKNVPQLRSSADVIFHHGSGSIPEVVLEGLIPQNH